MSFSCGLTSFKGAEWRLELRGGEWEDEGCEVVGGIGHWMGNSKRVMGGEGCKMRWETNGGKPDKRDEGTDGRDRGRKLLCYTCVPLSSLPIKLCNARLELNRKRRTKMNMEL